jgi:hypothetical protein
VIIATEGEKTEKQYFDIFENTRIQVRVISTEDGLSSPEHVFERLKEFHEQYELNDDDELWLMIDVDRWGNQKLSQISSATRQKGFSLAISNPCFEVWLLLHLVDVIPINSTCNNVKARLRRELGSYNPSNLDIGVYRPFVGEAVRRARNLRQLPNERWPRLFGSHVYKVVESLL